MLVLITGLLGLLMGSAINAIVWRIKVHKSWVHGRSMCPDCEHTLAPKDLIPVVSWVFLGGRCRYCKAVIKDHPNVELVTAISFALSAYALAPKTTFGWINLTFWLVLLILLIILAVYDLRWMILPDRVVLPLAVLAAVYTISFTLLTHHPHVLVDALEAAVAGFLVFYLLYRVTGGKGMGYGDVKLVPVLGLILGVKLLALALLLAFNVGAIVGIGALIMKRGKLRTQMPFGPFLVGGTIIAMLYGHPIVEWYLHLNGLN